MKFDFKMLVGDDDNSILIYEKLGIALKLMDVVEVNRMYNLESW